MKNLNKNYLSVLCLLSLMSFPNSYAGMTTDFSGDITTRYEYADLDKTPDKNVLRNSFSIGVRIKADGMFEIVSLISTGSKYAGPMDDVYNFTTDTFDYHPNVNVRQIYIEKKFGENVTTQLGALNPGDGVSLLTGFNHIGWVDGGRIKVKTPYGDIDATLGSLNDINNPNAFNRDRDLNFFELKVTEEFFDKLVKAEGGYEHWREHDFIKGAVKIDLKVATNKILELMAETMVDVNNGDMIESVGVTSDFLYLLTGHYKNRLKVTVAYTHADDGVNDRLVISKKDFLRTGHGAWIKAVGDISPAYGLSWNAELRISNEDEVRIAISKKL